jgi:hypothetical protein
VADPITATNEAVLMTEPRVGGAFSSRCGIPCLQHKKTLRRLVACTRSHASSPPPSGKGLLIQPSRRENHMPG